MPKQDMPTIEDFIRDGVPVSSDGYFVGHLANSYRDYCKLQHYMDYRNLYRRVGHLGLG